MHINHHFKWQNVFFFFFLTFLPYWRWEDEEEKQSSHTYRRWWEWKKAHQFKPILAHPWASLAHLYKPLSIIFCTFYHPFHFHLQISCIIDSFLFLQHSSHHLFLPSSFPTSCEYEREREKKIVQFWVFFGQKVIFIV